MSIETITAGTAGTNWVPTIWAREILRALRNNIVLLPRINRDFDSQVSERGKTINIPLPFSLTAQAAPLASTTASNVTPTTTPVSLDKFYTVDFEVEDVGAAQAAPNIMQNAVEAAGIALAEQVENDIWALYTNFATGAVGTAGTDITAAIIRAARKVMVDNKVPKGVPMTAALSTKDYDALLGDANISQVMQYGNAQAIQEGRVGRLFGMEVVESQLVPVVAGTPNTTYNLVFSRDAMVMVTRPLPLPTAGVAAAIVTDTESGLAFRMTLQYDINKKANRMSIDILYGVAALRAAFGVQVLA